MLGLLSVCFCFSGFGWFCDYDLGLGLGLGTRFGIWDYDLVCALVLRF